MRNDDLVTAHDARGGGCFSITASCKSDEAVRCSDDEVRRGTSVLEDLGCVIDAWVNLAGKSVPRTFPNRPPIAVLIIVEATAAAAALFAHLKSHPAQAVARVHVQPASLT